MRDRTGVKFLMHGWLLTAQLAGGSLQHAVAAARAAAATGPGSTPPTAETSVSPSPLGDVSAEASPWAQEVLARHNVYRCMHDAPPLTWNSDLEANAKQWVFTGQGQRSPPYLLQNIGPFALIGENIANGVTDGGGFYSPAGSVGLWYGQVGATPGQRGEVTHYVYETAFYTQVVWRSTTSVGCAWYSGTFICHYGPAGNRDGEYSANVLPLQRQIQDC